MSAKIIDGKILAAEVKACAAQAVRFLQERYGITPCLAVLLVGDDPASQVYVRGKISDCEACGIESRVIRLPAGTTQAELLARLGALAADSAVHGILVQLPLPRHIDPAAVIEAIPPEKDVDGFTPVNAGRLLNGEPCFAPCTPAGCLRMIEAAGVDLDGKHAVVVGRSNIVGKPAALLLMQKTRRSRSAIRTRGTLPPSAARPMSSLRLSAKPGSSRPIWSSPARSSSTSASTAARTASCTAMLTLPPCPKSPPASRRCPAALAS